MLTPPTKPIPQRQRKGKKKVKGDRHFEHAEDDLADRMADCDLTHSSQELDLQVGREGTLRVG